MNKDQDHLAAAPEQHGELSEPTAWLVCSVNGDGSLMVEHSTAWEQAAHDHINDAINEHDIEDAATWVVRPAYTADQLRTAIAAERERNPWRMAIDDALVTAHLGVATDDPYDDLNLLLDWHHDIWLDPAVSSDAQALIDRGAAASEAELSTLRKQLAEAVRERDALRSVVQSALNNNGGPIDADSTLDGKSYVMVLREDFDAIDAAMKQPARR